LPLVEGVPQADEHALARERLLDEVERPLLRRLNRRADRAVARDDDDRERVVHRPQPVEHLETVHPRHLDVEQHEVGGVALRQHESFLAGGGADEIVAFVLECHPQRVADGRFIIDDENA
jgi:hypothetical protein